MLDMTLNILKGLPATLGVTVFGFIFGALLAMPLVLLRRSHLWFLSLPARLYIDVVRGIPPLVWLFIIFFGLGSGWFYLTSFQAAIIGFGMIASAYLAEIYRGGFMALPIQQDEASKALGMTRIDTLYYVIAPQVLRVSIPAMATFLVSLLKDSTVASTIGVRDVMMFVSQESQASSGGLAPFIIAGFLYILLSIPVAYFARVMDRQARGGKTS